MVSKDWKVYLLEVNPGPDFKQTGSRLSRVITQLMSNTIDAALLSEEFEPDAESWPWCTPKRTEGVASACG